MYRVLDESSGNTIGMQVDGKLTKDDYGVLIPYIENLITESGPLNLLCDMTNFSGIEIEAFWEDFKFSIRHLRDFKRMAVVGDQRWLEWWTKFLNPLIKTEAKYFSPEQMSEAWNWLRAGNQ